MIKAIKNNMAGVIGLLYFVVLFLFIHSIVGSKDKEEISKLKQYLELERASRDSLTTYYDREVGRYIAEKSILVAEKNVLDAFLKDRDRQLHNLLKKYDAVAAAISDLEVRMDTTVVKYDTVYADTSGREVRVASIKDEYRDITVTSYPDSVELRPFRIMTEQSVVMGEDGKIRIINTNPYIEVKEIRSFYVKPPVVKKHTWRNIGIGVGVGLVGGILISK